MLVTGEWMAAQQACWQCGESRYRQHMVWVPIFRLDQQGGSLVPVCRACISRKGVFAAYLTREQNAPPAPIYEEYV